MKNEESEDYLKKRIDLYLKGRLSAREKATMDQQLEALKKSDPTPYDFNQQEVWKKVSAETINKTNHRGRLWIWFAAAIVFAGVAALLTLSWNPQKKELSNKIILTDGTIVWLKAGAALDHSKFTAGDRQVTLQGEALFEVAKLSGHPFVIHCGRYEARVLGTSFNIKASDSSVELTVLTGTVKLSSLKTDSMVLVNPNEHILFSESTINKESFTKESIQLVIANTEYDMHFEDTRMNDVVRRVEGKFDVKVHLENTDIGNCMISADFTDQSLPITLTMISEALGFHYEIDGNDIVITGTGCAE